MFMEVNHICPLCDGPVYDDINVCRECAYKQVDSDTRDLRVGDKVLYTKVHSGIVTDTTSYKDYGIVLVEWDNGDSPKEGHPKRFSPDDLSSVSDDEYSAIKLLKKLFVFVRGS
jgi:hypothetical protein